MVGRCLLAPPARCVRAKARNAMWHMLASSSIRMQHSVLMRLPSSTKHGGIRMPFTIAAPTMVLRMRWLCSLMHTSEGLRRLKPPKSDCSGAAQCNSSGRTSLVREHHARHVRGLQKPCATDRKNALALQHVTAKVQSFQAVFRCQSRRTHWLEESRLEIVMVTCFGGSCPMSDAAAPSQPSRSRQKPAGATQLLQL